MPTIRRCCIVGCLSNSRQTPNLQFFQFPRPENPFHQIWKQACHASLSRILPFKKPVVCALHFAASAIGGRRLTSSAVPSIRLEVPTDLKAVEQQAILDEIERSRKCAYINAVVYEWLVRANLNPQLRGSITHGMIKEKADTAKQVIGAPSFTADNRWLNRFRESHLTGFAHKLATNQLHPSGPSLWIPDIVQDLQHMFPPTSADRSFQFENVPEEYYGYMQQYGEYEDDDEQDQKGNSEKPPQQQSMNHQQQQHHHYQQQIQEQKTMQQQQQQQSMNHHHHQQQQHNHHYQQQQQHHHQQSISPHDGYEQHNYNYDDFYYERQQHHHQRQQQQQQQQMHHPAHDYNNMQRPPSRPTPPAQQQRMKSVSPFSPSSAKRPRVAEDDDVSIVNNPVKQIEDLTEQIEDLTDGPAENDNGNGNSNGSSAGSGKSTGNSTPTNGNSTPTPQPQQQPLITNGNSNGNGNASIANGHASPAPTPTPVKDLTSYSQALEYLKPLEEFALFKENFRAIGLLSQLEMVFRKSDRRMNEAVKQD